MATDLIAIRTVKPMSEYLDLINAVGRTEGACDYFFIVRVLFSVLKKNAPLKSISCEF